jgi:hypothetical protein
MSKPEIEAKNAAYKLDRETRAVQALRHQFAEELADDEDMNFDLIEGETSFLETLDLVYEAMQQDAERIEGIKKRSAELTIREKRFTARQNRLKGIIEQAMMVADTKKLERPEGTFSIARRQPSVEIVDESSIPAAFFITVDPKPSLAAIKKADELKALIAAMKAVRDSEDGKKGALPIEEALKAQSEAEEALNAAIPGLEVLPKSDSLTIRKA